MMRLLHKYLKYFPHELYTQSVNTFVFLCHVIHSSSCVYVFALSFGNVAFALTTPKTIRGCVTAMHFKDLSYPRFVRIRECIVPTLTVNLISSN